MSTLTDSSPPAVAEILTQSLDEFVKQQVAEQGLADETEYFKRLAEAERQQKITDYYEKKCLEALENDTWIPMTPEYWKEFLRKSEERRALRRAKEKQ